MYRQNEQNASFIFLVIVALSLLLVVHGGEDDVQIKFLVYIGTMFMLSVVIWIWFKKKYYCSKKQILISFAIVAASFLPAANGMLNFSVMTGFYFFVINLVSFLFVSQIVKHYGVAGPALLAKILVLAATIASLLAIVLLFYPIDLMGVSFGREGYYRLMGTFPTPNRFGEVPAVGVLAALYLFLDKRCQRKRWLMACLVFIFMTFLSGSKGVILGLVAGLFVFAVLTKLPIQKVVWRIFALFLPVVFFVGCFLYEYIVVATKLDLILTGRIGVGSGRYEIWSEGAEVFRNATLFQQVFGLGATAFVKQVGADAHSMYWDLLINNGLFFWVVIFVVVFSAFFRALTAKCDHVCLVLGLSMVLFCFVRGLAMPTIFNGFNFSMLAFWSGVTLLLFARRPCLAACTEVSRDS